MNERHLYTGTLDRMPVPEALATIERYRVPGVATVRCGEEEKKIFINNAMIHFASSNLDDDRLGEYLLHRKIISQEDYDESVVRIRAGEGRQGKILVKMGVITPKDLYVHIRSQVHQIVHSVFSWTEGTLTFNVGLFKDEEIIKLNISIRKAILEGTKTVKDARFLISRMGSKTTCFKTNYTDFDIKVLQLTEEEKAFLLMINGKKPLYSLVTQGPLKPEENAKMLYALYCLKLIEETKEGGIIKVQV